MLPRHARSLLLAVLVSILTPRPAADTWSSGPAVPTVDGDTIDVPVVVDQAFDVSDVNVLVSASHASGAQLTAWLRHPDGTEVQLFDRPAGTQLSFACFDDEATQSLGPGPLHRGSFVADEPLSAFDGKPALGSWTLRVRDRTGNGTGTLRSVTLAFNGRTYVTADVDLPLLDFETTSPAIPVADSFVIGDADVILSVTHAFPDDLFFFLASPDIGDFVMSPYGSDQGIGSGTVYVLDDESPLSYPESTACCVPLEAGRYAPAHPRELGLWTGLDASGLWELQATDNQFDDEGVFEGWALHLTEGPSCGAATWSVNLTGLSSGPTWPVVDLASAPVVGSPVDLLIDNDSAQPAPAILFLGVEPAALSGLGGTLWLIPLIQVPLLLPAGGLTAPITFDPSLCGVPILAQAWIADGALPAGVAMTRRLQILPGDG